VFLIGNLIISTASHRFFIIKLQFSISKYRFFKDNLQKHHFFKDDLQKKHSQKHYNFLYKTIISIIFLKKNRGEWLYRVVCNFGAGRSRDRPGDGAAGRGAGGWQWRCDSVLLVPLDGS
jgi:hypothetical protein